MGDTRRRCSRALGCTMDEEEAVVSGEEGARGGTSGSRELAR